MSPPLLLFRPRAEKGSFYAFNEWGDVLVRGGHTGCGGWWAHEDAWVYNPYFEEGTYDPMTTQPDGSWMEVLRFPTRRTGVGCDGGGYGCWFFGASGTGVAVPIGRSARFATKEQARGMVDRAGGQERLAPLLQPCRRDGRCDGPTHSDTYICAAARTLGYDSVMWSTEPRAHASGKNRNTVELVLCSEWCMNNVSCDECPGVEMRAVPEDGRPCACDATLGYANCNRTARAPDCTDVPSAPPARPPPALPPPIGSGSEAALLSLGAAAAVVLACAVATCGRAVRRPSRSRLPSEPSDAVRTQRGVGDGTGPC